MKQLLVILLSITLLIALTGCGTNKGPSSPAAKFCDDYMDDISDGEGLARQLFSEDADEGIMGKVLDKMRYKLISEEMQEDGSVLCTLKITTIDMKNLLENLPPEISSKEEAREKMLELARDAERTSREATIILIPSGEDGKFEVQYGNDFINAITGGMLELVVEAFEMEVAE